jgi:hypothetical protein
VSFARLLFCLGVCQDGEAVRGVLRRREPIGPARK